MLVKRNPFVYFGKKLLVFIVSIFALSLLVFYVARLAPGDPLVSYYGERTENESGGTGSGNGATGTE